MQLVIINSLYKNVRYRVFEWNSKYYLLDCDASILLLFFPLFAFFRAHKCYCIEPEEYKTLFSSTYSDTKPYQFVGATLCIISGTTLLRRYLVKALLPELPNVAAVSKFGLLFIILFFVLGFRFQYSHKKRLSLDYEGRPYVFVKMSPAHWKMAVGKIMGYFILLFLLLWCVCSIMITDEVDSFIILGIIPFLLFLLMFANISLWDLKEYQIVLKSK